MGNEEGTDVKRFRPRRLLAGLAFALAWSVAANVPVSAASTAFQLAADQAEVRQGDTVTISLTGTDLQDLYAYEAVFGYDPQAMEWTGSQPGLAGFPIAPIRDGGSLTVAFTKSGDEPGEDGSAALHTLTFKALAAGRTSIRLESVRTIDSQLARFDAYAGNAVELTVAAGSSGGSEGSGGSGGSGGEGSAGDGNAGSDGQEAGSEAEWAHEFGTISENGDTSTLRIEESRIERAIQADGAEIVLDLSSLTAGSGQAVDIPASVLSRIGEAGQSIVIRSAGVRLVLPPDSLRLDESADSVLITIQSSGRLAVLEEGFAAATDTFDITIRSGTSDVPVAQPIEVAFELGDVSDPRKAGVYYWNESSRQWEYAGGKYHPADGTIVFQAEHFSRYAGFVYHKTFTDVVDGFWAQDDIEVLAAKHMIKGVDDLRFDPQRSVSRAEFARMASGLLGLPEATPGATPGATSEATPGAAPEATSDAGRFRDVPANAAYAGVVAAVAQAGIMQGDGTLFRPNDKMTRQEIAAVAMRAYASLGLSVSGAPEQIATYADASLIAPWAQEAVADARLAGLMVGRPGNLFAPLQDVTRAEAAAMIYRLLDKSGGL